MEHKETARFKGLCYAEAIKSAAVEVAQGTTPEEQREIFIDCNRDLEIHYGKCKKTSLDVIMFIKALDEQGVDYTNLPFNSTCGVIRETDEIGL